MIIDHTCQEYIKQYDRMSIAGRCNGAYFYSIEIVNNIIPLVDTDRNWVTIRAGDRCMNHSIVFIHNNLHPERYSWLAPYSDLVLVCGVPETCEKVRQFGIPVYVPLSIDVEYVQNFTCEKTRGVAYAGRPSKRNGIKLASGTDFL